MDPSKVKAALEEELARVVSEHPDNRNEDGETFFDAPLVGYARATDKLFTRYKEIIGDFHQTPQEAFATVYMDETLKGGTVISWVLPTSAAIRKAQAAQDRVPDRKWAHTRWYGQLFNDTLSRHIAEFLKGMGIRAVPPSQMPSFRRVEDERVGFASTWSERHVAYAAGLGTFSINDGLITEAGIAHRLGSVVAQVDIPSTPIMGDDYRGNCLFVMKGTCGVCMKRCPEGAIDENGHDKAKCNLFTYHNVKKVVGPDYAVPITGCGLCQVGVPCESKIPTALKNG